MLNAVFRRAALRARAPLLRLACFWAASVPAAQAVEPPSPETPFPAPFNTYQSWRDEPLQDWRQANERVGEIGGWRTYLREAQPGDGTADESGQAHHGHHGH